MREPSYDLSRLTESTSVQRGKGEEKKKRGLCNRQKRDLQIFFSFIPYLDGCVEIALQMVKDEEIITLSQLYSSLASHPNPSSSPKSYLWGLPSSSSSLSSRFGPSAQRSRYSIVKFVCLYDFDSIGFQFIIEYWC